ncbi:MAG: hypothetical protein ACLUOI_24080 [Eisenbergiella sp.]
MTKTLKELIREENLPRPLINMRRTGAVCRVGRVEKKSSVSVELCETVRKETGSSLPIIKCIERMRMRYSVIVYRGSGSGIIEELKR